jgi:co-chaperonin GroES (HSP10)
MSPSARVGATGQVASHLGRKLDSVDYLIMKESDIMGVLQETVAKKKAA